MRNTHLPDPHTEWTEDDARLALEKWHRSGKSIAVFAREHGVGAARLYWWKKRLPKADISASTMSLVPATITPAAGAPIVIRFIEIKE
jgi:transposase-like protein